MKTRSADWDLDPSKILNSIWVKNALRRKAGLPLWPMRETFQREVWQAQWRAHIEAHYDAVRARVLDELRARHGEGYGISAGGRWVVEARTSQVLRGSFRPD